MSLDGVIYLASCCAKRLNVIVVERHLQSVDMSSNINVFSATIFSYSNSSLVISFGYNPNPEIRLIISADALHQFDIYEARVLMKCLRVILEGTTPYSQNCRNRNFTVYKHDGYIWLQVSRRFKSEISIKLEVVDAAYLRNYIQNISDICNMTVCSNDVKTAVLEATIGHVDAEFIYTFRENITTIENLNCYMHKLFNISCVPIEITDVTDFANQRYGRIPMSIIVFCRYNEL